MFSIVRKVICGSLEQIVVVCDNQRQESELEVYHYFFAFRKGDFRNILEHNTKFPESPFQNVKNIFEKFFPE